MAGVDDLEGPTRSGTDSDTIAEGSVGHRRQRSRTLRERLATGAKLGRYLVEHHIGEGGMGIVYAATIPSCIGASRSSCCSRT